MEIVGRVKEVCYVFCSCVLPYHEAIISESDVGYYFVFVWQVFDQVFQVFGGDVCRRFLVTVLLTWMPQWFGGIISR